ncbi:DUF4343 domain-containing protein [Vibrio parahaemolyticus]|nr:DUF4343 domain-containing protein [Vibrio parahaemolyticus]
MIVLQKYKETGKIGKEEMAVLHHAIMEGLPYQYVSEDDIESISSIPEVSLFVGSVEGTRMALDALGKNLPLPNYYPEALTKFLGRHIEVGTIANVISRIASGERVFAKPVDQWKSWTGQVFSESEGFSILSQLDKSTKVWLAEEIEFESEFRVYVTNGKVVSIDQYSGDVDREINTDSITEAIGLLKNDDYHTDTYAFDWGLTKSGDLLLVEMNDAFAMGKYFKISNKEYYEFLHARWQSMTK